MRRVPSAWRLGMGEVFSDEESCICLEVGDGRGFSDEESSICLKVGDGRGFF